jgi:hypothetical protein
MLLIFTTKVNGYTFPLRDNAYDVTYLLDYVYQNQGAYKEEIDILDVDINGTNLEVTLIAPPIVDKHHYYHCRIHWDGDRDNYVNYSQAALGSSYGMGFIANNSLTFIVNSSGYEFEFIQNGTITVDHDKIIMPIINHEFIQNINNPAWIVIYTTNTYWNFNHYLYWSDYLPNGEAWWLIESTTPSTPSTTSSVPIMGLGFIVILPIIIAAKKRKIN